MRAETAWFYAAILFVALFIGAVHCTAGPTETEALQATADSVDDAIAQAVASSHARNK